MSGDFAAGMPRESLGQVRLRISSEELLLAKSNWKFSDGSRIPRLIRM